MGINCSLFFFFCSANGPMIGINLWDYYIKLSDQWVIRLVGKNLFLGVVEKNGLVGGE